MGPPEMYSTQGLGESDSDEDEPSGGSRDRGPRFDPYKMDAYSYGVTLQVTLLGEDAARRKTVRRKGPMMLPLHLNETENTELLTQLTETGRVSREGFELLEMLLRFDPSKRASLSQVVTHPWFST